MRSAVLVLIGLAVTLPCGAQTAAPSCLHSSNAEYERAIQDDYQSKLEKKFSPKAKYLQRSVNVAKAYCDARIHA